MEEKDSLAVRLDKDLNHYVEQVIEKNQNYRYAHPLSEDNWEKELENIPLFMTKSPDEVDPEKAPALAALQAIKFEDDDPNAKLLSLKDDGNVEFKKGNYKNAIKVYTEGINVKCSDNIAMSTLYANRANAHFKIGNYRSSLNDATKAKSINPGYTKAIFRGTCACMELERYDEAIKWCKEALAHETEQKTFQDILKKATLKLKDSERNKRKKLAEEKRLKQSNKKLIEAITCRGVKMRVICGEENEDNDNDPLSVLGISRENVPGKGQVTLDDNGVVHWPVLFVYPEHGQTDFIESFNENDRFCDHLQMMFSAEANVPWDVHKSYQPSKLQVYFEDIATNFLVHVEQTTSLGDVLSGERYVVYGGTPSFIILVNGSTFIDDFKGKYKH